MGSTACHQQRRLQRALLGMASIISSAPVTNSGCNDLKDRLQVLRLRSQVTTGVGRTNLGHVLQCQPKAAGLASAHAELQRHVAVVPRATVVAEVLNVRTKQAMLLNSSSAAAATATKGRNGTQQQNNRS